MDLRHGDDGGKISGNVAHCDYHDWPKLPEYDEVRGDVFQTVPGRGHYGQHAYFYEQILRRLKWESVGMWIPLDDKRNVELNPQINYGEITDPNEKYFPRNFRLSESMVKPNRIVFP